MLCDLLSLLTKATWLPRGTLTFLGLTVLFVIVIVAAGGVLGLVLLLPPPQEAAARIADAHAAARSQTRTLIGFRIVIIRPFLPLRRRIQ